MMQEFDTASAAFWTERYRKGHHRWDVGTVSKPLKDYFDQLSDKEMLILVPGAGFGWEAGYLYDAGFKNTFILDFSAEALQIFKQNHPHFPEANILFEDFFDHRAHYDLIVEQTFFSSIPRNKRPNYISKIYNLLRSSGKLVGLMFNHEFDFDGPPFGGTFEEYQQLFQEYFHFKVFEIAHNSIKPRRERELFLLFLKK